MDNNNTFRKFCQDEALFMQLLKDEYAKRHYMNIRLEVEVDKEWNIVYSCVVADDINPREKYLYCEV